MRLRGEYIYASAGRMRPVFLCPECAVARFSLNKHAGDEVRVQVSHDPPEQLRRGGAQWLDFEGGEGGGVHGATALRVVIGRLDGWVTLVLEQESDNDGCE
ncbi:MAG: hypothetical protein GC129_02550 [Proteobacteria bacterium]|nr:hypothetical protein [Pseudomonadota bacterium]